MCRLWWRFGIRLIIICRGVVWVCIRWVIRFLMLWDNCCRVMSSCVGILCLIVCCCSGKWCVWFMYWIVVLLYMVVWLFGFVIWLLILCVMV